MQPYYVIMRLPGETQCRIHPDAADGAARPRQYDFVAGRPMRRRRLWPSVRVCVFQRSAILRAISDSGAYQPESRNFAAILTVESDGIERSYSATCWYSRSKIPCCMSSLYIRAENGQLPELKRVLASYGDRTVMGEDIDSTLAAFFKGREGPPNTFCSRACAKASNGSSRWSRACCSPRLASRGPPPRTIITRLTPCAAAIGRASAARCRSSERR